MPTVNVPHLNGTSVGYRSSTTDASKPTLVLIVPFTTTVDYYDPEFSDSELADRVNLIAVEPLGHGATRTKAENFTYWDSAIIFLQLLDALGIRKAFVLGTSQGGWMGIRMELLAPEKEQVQGLILIGTSMDCESPRSRELGCWNGAQVASGLVQLGATQTPMPDFEPEDGYCDFLMEIGYGKMCPPELRDKWAGILKNAYRRDDGKRRMCMAATNLATRDGLHARLPFVKSPVSWLQGSADVVLSAANAQEEIKLFTNSPEAKLEVLQDGVHFLSHTHQKEVHQNIIDFVQKWQSS